MNPGRVAEPACPRCLALSQFGCTRNAQGSPSGQAAIFRHHQQAGKPKVGKDLLQRRANYSPRSQVFDRFGDLFPPAADRSFDVKVVRRNDVEKLTAGKAVRIFRHNGRQPGE